MSVLRRSPLWEAIDPCRGELATPPHDRAPRDQPLVLTPATLEAIVHTVGDATALWRGRVRVDVEARHYERLHLDDDFEVWLISWDLGQDTLLHDHGGSNGAFRVVAGALCEDHANIGERRLRQRSHPTSSSSAFGPRYVHNLVNTASMPAVSIHAYSPPLTTMSYYAVLDAGIERLRTLAVTGPEPDLVPSP